MGLTALLAWKTAADISDVRNVKQGNIAATKSGENAETFTPRCLNDNAHGHEREGNWETVVAYTPLSPAPRTRTHDLDKEMSEGLGSLTDSTPPNDSCLSDRP